MDPSTLNTQDCKRSLITYFFGVDQSLNKIYALFKSLVIVSPAFELTSTSVGCFSDTFMSAGKIVNTRADVNGVSVDGSVSACDRLKSHRKSWNTLILNTYLYVEPVNFLSTSEGGKQDK